MRFEIDPNPDETTRACGAIAIAAMPPSRATLILIGLYGAVVGAAYVLTPATIALTSLIGLAAVATTALLLQVDAKSRIRRLRVDDLHAREPHFVELTPDGIHTWCTHVDARFPWADFMKVIENNEFYLFVRASVRVPPFRSACSMTRQTPNCARVSGSGPLIGAAILLAR